MKFNNETLRSAINEWLKDDKKAASKYGHISNWDVSNVTNMHQFFLDAKSFNQDISSWNVSNVTDMSFMFKGSSFNQDLSSWDVSNVADFEGFSEYALLSETNKPNFIQ